MAAVLPLPPDGTFELGLRKQHLQQLRRVGLSDNHDHLPTAPWPLPRDGEDDPLSCKDLCEWSEQARDQIAKAVSNRVVSPVNMDWNNGLFTFLESAAVYLRDGDKVLQAAKEARKGTDEGDKRALQLLYDSQADIKKIAALWGLGFEVICDLIQYSPEGHPWLSGPYCGVFFNKDTSKPFLGLAFKGTNGSDWRQDATDITFALMMATGNILWGSPLHRGFYETMFLNFPHIDAAPLDFIKNMIDQFLQTYPVPEGLTIDLHITGHSLGGAYATLCYGELMRLYNNDPTRIAPDAGEDKHAHLREAFTVFKGRQFVLRDLYTFACPRVGGVMENKDWARNFMSAFSEHEGQSWRVKNDGDPVTDVPPVLSLECPFVHPWCHVDNGWKLDMCGKDPVLLPTEVGTTPSGYNLCLAKRHNPRVYFNNLYNASTTGPKIEVDNEDPENFEAGENMTENYESKLGEGAEL